MKLLPYPNPSLWFNLSILLELILGGQIIDWIPTQCPHLCKCGFRYNPFGVGLLRTVECSNAGLSRPPDNISTSTESLLLSRNRIHVAQLSVLVNNPNITVLDISGNRIYRLDSLPQTALLNLRHFSAERNEIDFLSNRTFLPVNHLLSLSLSRNKIEVLSSDAFFGLTELQHLDLSWNRLYEVNPRLFRDMTSLRVLNLGNNNIHTLRDNDFAPLLTLHTLILRSNHLKQVHNFSFNGLENLSQLYLQDNHLERILKIPLQHFNRLDLLDYSNNYIEYLEPFNFDGVKVSHLKLNRNHKLLLVDSHSFVNMSRLETLEIADNPSLMYIDQEAFVEVPRLTSLGVQKNNLSIFPEEVVDSLPSLNVLHLHDNPIHCDCVISWLHHELVSRGRNLTFPSSEDITCATPSHFSSTTLDSAALDDISSDICRPRLIRMFPSTIQTVLGERFRADCRAVGKPVPNVEWQLPAKSYSLSDDAEVVILPREIVEPVKDRKIITSTGTLLISYIKGVDHGKYRCQATNSIGKDQQTLQLLIRNMASNVILLRLTSTSITVTWRGSKYARDYQLLYRKSDTNDTYRVIDIKPYMRSFTASELQPATMYDFCIAFRHDDISLRINCTVISTKPARHAIDGVFSTKDYVIGGSIGCVVTFMVLLAIIGLVLRKYNERRRQEDELYGDNLSQLFLASMDSMSDVTGPVTYENRGIFDDDDVHGNGPLNPPNRHQSTRRKSSTTKERRRSESCDDLTSPTFATTALTAGQSINEGRKTA